MKHKYFLQHHYFKVAFNNTYAFMLISFSVIFSAS